MLVLLFITACTNSNPMPAIPAYSQPPSSGALIVRIQVPRNRFKPHYVSPSTASISVKISGPVNFKKTASLKLGATGCKSKLMTLECTLNVPGLKACPTKKPCYTGSVSTYDASKRVLSADQSFKFRIASGSTIIPLVLYGIPASVAFMPSTSSSLTGTQSSGFIEPKCSASAQSVSLLGVDADDNYIVGAGSPRLSLSSGDTSQLTVSNGARAGAFVLSPPALPAYPHGNHAITLTATATPQKQSGAPAVNTNVTVTYSGDICGVVDEFPVPNPSSVPFGIVAGPDGNLWFTEDTGNKIGRITTTGGITEFGGLSPVSGPGDITVGPDGDIWFAESCTSQIGKMSTSGTVQGEWPTQTGGVGPQGITSGPDHNIWFSESLAGKLEHITTTGSSPTEISITGSGPTTVVAGPDGNMWFTDFNNSAIYRVTVGGSPTKFTVPTAASSPSRILVGPDGNLWFLETNNPNYLADVTPSGAFQSLYPIPSSTSDPQGLAVGPDDAFYIAETQADAIARITLDGKASEYHLTATSYPTQITLGPDGAMWFTEQGTNKIGRLR
jgi:streptogramin lyase